MSPVACRRLVLPLALLLAGCPAHVDPGHLGGGPGGTEESLDDNDNGTGNGDTPAGTLCRDGRLDLPRAPADAELRDARKAAAKALDVLSAVRASSPKMAAELMLLPEEAAPMDLGRPLAIAKLRVDRLRENRDGAIGYQLRQRDQYVFPVKLMTEDGSIPTSSVTVVKQERRWKITTIGRRHLVQSLMGDWARSKLRALMPEERTTTLEEKAAESRFLIDVPTLYELYLATCRGDDLTLAPVFDDGIFTQDAEDPGGSYGFDKVILGLLFHWMGDEIRELMTELLDQEEWPLADGTTREQVEDELRRLRRQVLGQQSLEDVLTELRQKAEGYVPPLPE